VQFLIQVGRHPPDVVMGYSLRQLAAFTELAQGQQRVHQAELAGAMRLGMHASQEQFAKQLGVWLKHLAG
jgi:hypothetical protein